MSAAAAPTLALGPLQSRYSPAIGRLRVVRSASPAPSGPLRALQASGGTLGYPLKRPSTPVPAAADLRCGQRRQHPHRCRPDASSATILRLHHPHPCQLNRDPRTVVSYRGRCPSSRWRSGHGEQVAIAGSEVSGQAGAPSGAGSYPQCPQDAVPLPRTPTPFTATSCQTKPDQPGEPLTYRLLQVQRSLSQGRHTSAATCPPKRDTSNPTTSWPARKLRWASGTGAGHRWRRSLA